MARVVLFDIDGTLLHAGNAGKRAFIAAVEEVLGSIPDNYTLDARGQTDPILFNHAAHAILGRAMTETERSSLERCFVAHFNREIQDSPLFRVLPGVPELVHQLSLHDQVYLGIQTGNLEITAQQKLRRAGLQHYFEFGGYASDHSERKEFIAIALSRAEALYGHTFLPHEVVVLGDSVHDVHAAKHHDYRAIAVETSGVAREDLTSAGGDLVLEDLTQIERLVQFIIS